MVTPLRRSETDLLANLGRIFGINEADYGQRHQEALALMTLLFAMPAIQEKGQRRDFGRQVLQASDTLIPFESAYPYRGKRVSRFTAKVMTRVALFQEFPLWHGNFTASGSDLAAKHAMASDVKRVLGYLGQSGGLLGGAGAFAAAADAMISEGLSTRSAKTAARVGAARLSGVSASIEQGLKRLGLSGPKLARSGLVLAIAAAAAYASASENVSEIEAVMQHRLRDGTVAETAYQQVFPKSQPYGVRKYWQY